MEFKIYRSDETELINGCIRRERTAQKRLYDLYSPVMYPICCRYIRNSMEAEDVLVVSFTKIFEKISQYRAEGSFEGWMKRIVINESLAHLRKHPSMFILAAPEDIPDIESPETYDYFEEGDLIRMIQQLPAGYRSVFNLYAIDGFSHKEIAEKLGIAENTSKSQLSRARTFLQRLLVKSETLPNTKQHGQTS